MILAIAVPGNAAEFILQAKLFAAHWSHKGETVSTVVLGANKATWGADVLNAISTHKQPLDKVAFFCHGTRRSLLCGFGPKGRGNLAAALAERCTDRAAIALYSCWCGADLFDLPWTLTEKSYNLDKWPLSAGFAAGLVADLHRLGSHATVFAHATKGHTTHNPYCADFVAIGSSVYRQPLVDRKNKKEWRAWVAALQTGVRFDAPFGGEIV